MDFALTVEGRVLTPVALELNSGLCLEACGALEGLWAAQRPRSAAEDAAAAPLVETMLRRSAHCLVEGKQLLLIGAGGVSKKFVWEAARDYGLKVGGARGAGRGRSGVPAPVVEAATWAPGRGGLRGGASTAGGGACAGRARWGL